MLYPRVLHIASLVHRIVRIPAIIPTRWCCSSCLNDPGNMHACAGRQRRGYACEGSHRMIMKSKGCA